MKFNYMKSAAMALAFACCVSSCSDFLEEENKQVLLLNWNMLQ